MESSKIVKSLRKIPPETLKRFRLYLVSPYFNRSKTLLMSFETIHAFLTKTPKQKLTKDYFWEKTFPKESYKDVNLRKLNSDLLRVFKQFLAQEQYQNDPGKQSIYLMQAVSKHNLKPIQEIAIKQNNQYSEMHPFRNAQYYLHQYNKEKEYYQLINFDKKREAKSNVEDILKNLDLFYLSEKLYFYTSLIMRTKILSHDYHFLFIDEILEHLSTVNYNEHPSVAIHYNLTLALSDLKHEDAYKNLKELLKKHIQLFPKSEAYQLFTGAQNYAIAKINSGDKQYYEEYLDLFEQMIQNGLILEKDGTITMNKFRNVVVTAARLNRFEWAQDFIQEFRDKLPENNRESTIRYSQGIIYFWQKDFAKAVLELGSIHYDDVAFGLAAKVPLAISFYELAEFRTLEAHINATKVFLNRRKDIGKVRRNLLSLFYKYLDKLIRVTPGDKEAVTKFCVLVGKNEKLIHADWFCKKALELL